MDLRLDHPELCSAIDQSRDAVERLGVVRARADAEVAQLLDGGWRGPAASAFGEAWESWSSGARRVTEALRAISSALERTELELTTADGGAAHRSATLAERLG